MATITHEPKKYLEIYLDYERIIHELSIEKDRFKAVSEIPGIAWLPP